ncbi:hypothetical protein J2W22_004641 [Sphingomonas kyeonggiensis]|nr:hypothetical protein [Sphingomonas kyeonggiensis]
MRDTRQIEPARQVAQGDEEREPAALDAQPRPNAHFAFESTRGCAWIHKGGIETGDQLDFACEQVFEEGRMRARPGNGVGEIGGGRGLSHRISHPRNDALQNVKQQKEN